jgi:purine-binding chemotaxis protein CheW
MSTSRRLDLDAARARLERARRLVERAATPDPAAARAVLEERARALARPPPAPGPAVAIEALELFAGAGRIGVDAAICREVVRWSEPVEVPGLPPWFRGLAMHRGELLPAIAPDALLGQGSGPAPTRYAIVGRARPELALAATAIGELLRLPADALRSPPPGADPLVRALGPGALLVLGADALLSDPRLFHGGEG